MPRDVIGETLKKHPEATKWLAGKAPKDSQIVGGSADMPQGVKREKLCGYADMIEATQCRRPPNPSTKGGCYVRENTRRAPKNHRHDSRSIKSSPYSDDNSTTSRHARTRRPESVHQGNGRGRFDDEYDQAQYQQATPAPPTPAPPTPTPIVPQATPTPPTPAPPTPAPAAPDHTQNDAAQNPATDVDATHDDAAHAHAADAHTSQTGGSPVDSEQVTAGPTHQ